MGTDAERAVERLERRLRELEDERAILDTLYAYAHSLDYGDREAWIDCWTEDAELHWPHAVFAGVSEIAGAFDGHSHAPEAFHKHLLVEPRVRVEGDRASATSYFSRFDASPDGPVVRSFGRYVDELRRCPDGKWRLARRLTDRESLIPNAPVT